MKAGIFFDRAIREAKRYGDDPWIFLRELVQNSRDAGATHVYCHSYGNNGWTYLDFQDNGDGMDAGEFERYLLRLYASSKENNRDAIGFYGVGFWSTLLFEPQVIRFVSRRKGVTVGYEIECLRHQVTTIEANLKNDGTRITLIRPEHPEDKSLAELVRTKLIHYTGPVRPAPGRDLLELVCNGEIINQPFQLPPHFGKHLRKRDFDGVIGLGHQPWVRLYKGGILVRDLTSLEEVLPNRTSRLPGTGLGLYPQIAINADGLTVLMDRQSVFEDPLLLQIVQVSEKHLIKTQRQMVQQLFPMNWRNRLLNWRHRFKPGHLVWPLILLGMLTLAILLRGPLADLGFQGTPADGSQPEMRPGFVDSAFNNWSGPEIDRPGSSLIQWQFEYEGGPPFLLFRMTTFSQFDKMRGWEPGRLNPQGVYPTIQTAPGEAPILVRMTTRKSGAYFALPVPPKYGLVAGSVVTASGKKPQVLRNDLGEPLVLFNQGDQVSYQVVHHPGFPPPEIRPAMVTDDYPPDFQNVFREIEGLAPRQKAEAIADFLSQRFQYSRSSDAAEGFNQSKGDFLQRLQTVGRGDCDLLNGTYALMLQTAGIPAFLSVGLVGRKGTVQSNLHAWVRFWVEGEWVTADIIAPQHLHIIRPNQTLPVGPPANLDQVPSIQRVTSADDPQHAAPEKNAQVDPHNPTEAATGKNLNPWLFFGLAVAAGIGALIWLWRHRPRRHPEIDRPNYLASLFENYFQKGLGDDPLRLAFRPLFPTLQGGKLSLFQLRETMAHSPLLGAKADCPLVQKLPKKLPILDRDQPHYQLLGPFLPQVVWLDELDFLIKPNTLPPELARLNQTLRQFDPGFRLHIHPYSDRWQTLHIPFQDAAYGHHHLVIGRKHPSHQILASLEASPSPRKQFEAMRVIMEKTTFFLQDKDRALAELLEKSA